MLGGTEWRRNISEILRQAQNDSYYPFQFATFNFQLNEMKILVTGANGQLGREMRIVSQNTDWHCIFTDVVEAEGLETTLLDITNLEAVRRIVREQGVQCIVNCAAYTNVDKAESDEAFCRVLNADAPRNLAQAMKEVGGLLVHVSTDYVFGGDPYNTPCKEDQKGTPTGAYGRTKLEGEQNILAAGCDYVILRTAWLYSEFGKNFVKTMLNLTNQEYAALSDEDRLALMNDDSKIVMTLTCEGVDGSFSEYKFYKYVEESTGKISGGKIFVSVNGAGEFYTTNDLVDKVINDTSRVLKGLDVDAYGQR